MTVAFVCSGNSGISPIVKAQAESLNEVGLDITIIPVIGKGLMGYLRYIKRLRRQLRAIKPDIVHAHYSFCGIISTLSTTKPIITSLMGSDVNQSSRWRFILRLFIKYAWDRTIVKSESMKIKMGIDDLLLLPNGVDINVFRPLDKKGCRMKLGWDLGVRVILFASDPDRPEKDYTLAQEAVSACKRKDIQLAVIHKLEHKKVPIYLNASDLLLLTSKWEGSPNIVKEAMACNVPVVSTDVGDVKWLFGTAPGYCTTTTCIAEISQKITEFLDLNPQAEGRDRIKALGIDSYSIAEKMFAVYESTLHKKKRN